MIAELTGRGLVKVVRMSAKRVYLVILVLAIGCQQAGVGADMPELSVSEGASILQKDHKMGTQAIAEAELDTQLKINRTALLEGPGEQIRIDAATVMLFSQDPLARRILLAALEQSENSAAREAICKALSQARTEQKPINQREDFIQPLIEVLKTDTGHSAKLAAEATLIFEYEQTREPLEKIVTDTSLPTKSRLNAIYALQLQPDMKAVFRLIELLGEPESQVATEAEKALRSLGIPVGRDLETRRQIIEELERKGRDAFLRDWLIRQEAQMSRLRTEANLWKGLYLGALGRVHDGISDDAARGQFLAEHLGNSEAIVRLWALEKVHRWWVGTGKKTELLAELGSILLDLISDGDRNVRLKTAKLLALMVELNSAEKLLEQLKVEQDDGVRTELFVALGGACYYAFLPDAGFKIPEGARMRTLEWAAKYLGEDDPKKVQKGAEVIKKLLEQDGLAPVEVDKYLGLLVNRYNQQANGGGGSLRGELLSAMAGLCAQSVYKAKAARLFEPLFEEALRDETDLVREAAVDGLVYIDKTRALKRFRKVLVNDRSAIIREKKIDLASEVGGQEDLVWLAEIMRSTAGSEPAWQAMLKIFNRSGAAVLNDWMTRFGSQNASGKLSDKQMGAFLEIAEAKANSENKKEMLEDVREKLAGLCKKSGDFERAAEYFGMLRNDARTAEEKEAYLAELLDVYLKGSNVNAAKDLVAICLLERDLEPDSAIASSIDNYLREPPAGADRAVLLDIMTEIKAPAARPKWEEQVERWKRQFGQPKQPGKPEGAGV